MSSTLRGSEYGVDDLLAALQQRTNVRTHDQLHLATSMRPFRAERLSEFVRLVLESEVESAAELYTSLASSYPIVLTRDINLARAWLRRQARGSERFGIVSITILPLTSTIVDAPLIRLTVDPGRENGLTRVSHVMVDKVLTLPPRKDW